MAYQKDLHTLPVLPATIRVISRSGTGVLLTQRQEMSEQQLSYVESVVEQTVVVLGLQLLYSPAGQTTIASQSICSASQQIPVEVTGFWHQTCQDGCARLA